MFISTVILFELEFDSLLLSLNKRFILYVNMSAIWFLHLFKVEFSGINL